MATNNAEILAQLEKLSEAQERDVPLVEGCWHVAEALGARGNGSRIMKLVDSFTVDVDFSTILAAVRRWVKIEEAARAHVDKRRDAWVAAVARGYDEAFATEHWPTVGVFEEGVDALDAALTAYRATQTKEPRDEAK